MAKRKNNPQIYYAESPSSQLGLMWAATSEKGVWSVSYGIDADEFRSEILRRGPAHLLYSENEVAPIFEQIHQFLRGERKRFDLEIDWSGMTPFQIAVRRAVMNLPYGQTASYGDIAAQVGHPRAARAVGGVQASNPISFIIPCHRVVGADGSLHGYGGFGGLHTKAWLIELEGTHK